MCAAGVEKLQNRLGSRGLARLGALLFVPMAMMSVLPSMYPHAKVAVLLTLCLAFCMNAGAARQLVLPAVCMPACCRYS